MGVYVLLGYGLPEAWPACARLVLGVRAEKVQTAGGKVTVNIQPKPEKKKDDKAAKGGAPAGKDAKGGGGAKEAPKAQKDTANVKTPKSNAPSGGKGGEKAIAKPVKPGGK